MKRSIGIYIVTLGLLFNGLYIIFNAIEAPYMSSFAWGVISIISGWGVITMKYWSQYIVGMLALFSISGWVDGLIQVYKTGWHYHTSAETLISLFPGICLVTFWLFSSILVIQTLKKEKAI